MTNINAETKRSHRDCAPMAPMDHEGAQPNMSTATQGTCPTTDPPTVADTIRAWRERNQVDTWALTIDDLPPEMATPKVRDLLAAMSDEDRAFALFVGLAAATMTPAEREAVGFKMVDRSEPTAEDLQSSDEAAVQAIKARFPGAPEDEADWDSMPISAVLP